MREKLIFASVMIGLSISFLAGKTPGQGDEKARVPDPGAQKKAEKLIREVFKEEYDKRSQAEMVALSVELLQQGPEIRDDSVVRFVAFREAADLAAQAGDLEAAFRALDAMSKEYNVDRMRLRMAALTTVARTVQTTTAHHNVAEAGLKLCNEAISADKIEAGLRILAVAQGAAKKSQDVRLAERVQARVQELRKVQAARAKLKDNPEEPAANLVLGQFLCLRKGEWELGLPLLLKADDSKLKALAEKDLARPADAARQVDVGDGWWALAEAKQGMAKKLLRLRAGHWYRRARPHLAGLTKTRVDQKLLSTWPSKSTMTRISTASPFSEMPWKKRAAIILKS
jgi:hypothetical protein